MYVSDKLPHGYVVIGCYMGNDGIMYPTIPLFVKKKKEAGK